MTDTAKPPAGAYILHSDPENPNEAFVLYANGYAAFHGSSYGREERAKLLVEAGTVYHETNRTPRELADERAELLAACNACLQGVKGWQVMIHNAVKKCEAKS